MTTGPPVLANIGNVATLDGAVAALNQTERATGKTIIRIRSYELWRTHARE